MKLIFALFSLLWSLQLFASNCEPVSAKVSKCTSIYATYITEVGKCSERIQTLTGFYKYFTYKVVVLNTQWLEDATGIVPGSLEKIVTRDGLRMTKIDNVCQAWRDEQAAKVTPIQEVDNAVNRFVKR